jgi:urease accessory protein
MSGEGNLRFVHVRGKTALETAYATSPMHLLTPKNHGDAAWVFVASLGGGLVDGDELRLRVHVERGARALLGTQASTKVYRSRRGSSQSLDAVVDDDALLAVIPDPVVCFAEARYAQRTTIALAPGASLVFLEAMTCGRSARGERWAFHSYASKTRIERDGRPIFVDGVLLEPEHGALIERVGRFDAIATLVVIGAQTEPIRAALASPSEPPTAKEDCVSSVFPLGHDGVVARVAAISAERAATCVRDWLAPLARVLGDDPFARKW